MKVFWRGGIFGFVSSGGSTFHFLVVLQCTHLEVEDTFNYNIFFHLYVTIISTLAWEQFWKGGQKEELKHF